MVNERCKVRAVGKILAMAGLDPAIHLLGKILEKIDGYAGPAHV
jgi:hypothetical protein